MLSRALAARHGTARLPATAGALLLARALRHDSDRDASSRAAGPPLQAASDSHSGPIRLTRTQVIMITRVAVHDWSGPVITESLERPGRRPSRLPLAVTLSGSHGSKFCPARDGVCARRPGHHSLAASARLGARARPEKLEP